MHYFIIYEGVEECHSKKETKERVTKIIEEEECLASDILLIQGERVDIKSTPPTELKVEILWVGEELCNSE